MKYEGEKFKFLHTQNIDPILKEAQRLRQAENNGFSDDRNYRRVALIPELVWLAHPELLDEHGRINRNELKKFLNSPEGEGYKTVNRGI